MGRVKSCTINEKTESHAALGPAFLPILPNEASLARVGGKVQSVRHLPSILMEPSANRTARQATVLQNRGIGRTKK